MDATTIHVQRGQLVALDDARGFKVRAGTGDLWITQAGDSRDIVLRAGESFVIERPGLTLVNAPEAAWLTLEPQRARSGQLCSRPCATAMASPQTG